MKAVLAAWFGARQRVGVRVAGGVNAFFFFLLFLDTRLTRLLVLRHTVEPGSIWL